MSAMHRFDTNAEADRLLSLFVQRVVARTVRESAYWTPAFDRIYGVPRIGRVPLDHTERVHILEAFAAAGIAIEAHCLDYHGRMADDPEMWGCIFVRAVNVDALRRALETIPGALDEPVMTITNIKDIAPD
jgi:hypothetical protein